MLVNFLSQILIYDDKYLQITFNSVFLCITYCVSLINVQVICFHWYFFDSLSTFISRRSIAWSFSQVLLSDSIDLITSSCHLICLSGIIVWEIDIWYFVSYEASLIFACSWNLFILFQIWYGIHIYQII